MVCVKEPLTSSVARVGSCCGGVRVVRPLFECPMPCRSARSANPSAMTKATGIASRAISRATQRHLCLTAFARAAQRTCIRGCCQGWTSLTKHAIQKPASQNLASIEKGKAAEEAKLLPTPTAMGNDLAPKRAATRRLR